MRLRRAFKAFFNALKKQQLEISPPSKEESAHLHLLAILQREGRLLDFLKEDISSYNDAQIGAAVRTIHAKCQKSIEEFVTLRPIFQEDEGSLIIVPKGYDPLTIKMTGKVKGDPPYQGILRHKGWKAHKEALPKQLGAGNRAIVCPAEIEVE